MYSSTQGKIFYGRTPAFGGVGLSAPIPRKKGAAPFLLRYFRSIPYAAEKRFALFSFGERLQNLTLGLFNNRLVVEQAYFLLFLLSFQPQ
jgi:hypothetical protein